MDSINASLWGANVKSERRTKPRRKEKPRILVQQGEILSDSAKDELMRVAEEYGWQLWSLSITNSDIPVRPKPDGAIITSPSGSRRPSHRGRVFSFPTVLLRKRGEWIPPSCHYPTVVLDRYAAGQMAMDYFHENGFHDVLFILRRPLSDIGMAYRGAMDRAGELGLKVHLVEAEPCESDPYKIKEQWRRQQVVESVSKLPKPLAYFAPGDHRSASFCYYCQSYGLSVPEDVAVLGVGNREFLCETAPVALSSVDLNRPKAVRAAADLLRRMLGGETVSEKRILIPPKGVVVRRSTDMLAVPNVDVARAVRYLWDHVDWPITVDDVSYEVGVPKRTLSRLFKQHLGRGINEELQRKRLEICADLLKNTDLTMREIGRRIGFASQTYLHRKFLKIYGTTPAKFRKQRQAQISSSHPSDTNTV